ncbi:2-acyl-1-lysophosphatidylinositol acyltransferase [[Candida] jaroonii]|uniref:2-acyl-1-lysophosphatidylinositol acyltransferase n=1 Tax=[Candida] jaroonii TaxID=467808 RepID=A0ACA9YED8_9ASCO|nr:2-acyl-1-lysophosphatidylinositol acyltransferase [[Candida] jaroonii]
MSIIPTPIIMVKNGILLLLFMLGCVILVGFQLIIGFIFKNSPGHKHDGIGLTKTYFVQMMAFFHANASPNKISITYDSKKLPEGNEFTVNGFNDLQGILSPNSIIISNHQIYTDWLYVWFLLYTSKLSSTIHIILKDLSKVPILGYGMRNYNFLFLSRKWEQDKVILTNQLLAIDANARGSGPANGIVHTQSTNITNGVGDVKVWPNQNISKDLYPYTIVLYPEGTVPSLRTTKKSKEYCEQVGKPILNHVLLPRVRGLYLSLLNLRNSVSVVYDITTGYSGLKEKEFGEDIYTLKNVFLRGKGPKQVNYHIRAFNISEIPLGADVLDIDQVKEDDLKRFEDWLFKVWYEKDELMDTFYKYGKFITSDDPNFDTYKTVVADMKLRSVLELTPVVSFALILFYLIGKIFKFIFG